MSTTPSGTAGGVPVPTWRARTGVNRFVLGEGCGASTSSWSSVRACRWIPPPPLWPLPFGAADGSAMAFPSGGDKGSGGTVIGGGRDDEAGGGGGTIVPLAAVVVVAAGGLGNDSAARSSTMTAYVDIWDKGNVE